MTECDDSCGCRDGTATEKALRELGRFSLAWTLGPVLGALNGEAPTRADVDRRIVARAAVEPAFRSELLEHPRWVYMVAVGEAFGLSKLAFLRQVREVRVLEERAGLLYLVLPVAPDLEARFLGLSKPRIESEEGAGRGERSVREEVERRLLAAAREEGPVRQALLFQPQESYVKAAREVTGDGIPAFLRPVREVRVVPETATSLALALPVGAG
jgi:hypothetical protein